MILGFVKLLSLRSWQRCLCVTRSYGTIPRGESGGGSRFHLLSKECCQRQEHPYGLGAPDKQENSCVSQSAVPWGDAVTPLGPGPHCHRFKWQFLGWHSWPDAVLHQRQWCFHAKEWFHDTGFSPQPFNDVPFLKESNLNGFFRP